MVAQQETGDGEATADSHRAIAQCLQTIDGTAPKTHWCMIVSDSVFNSAFSVGCLNRKIKHAGCSPWVCFIFFISIYKSFLTCYAVAEISGITVYIDPRSDTA